MINEYLENMLKNVDDEYDKSEGGLFHDTLAPASIEIEKAYKKAKFLYDMSNPLTAKGEYLDIAIKGRIGDRVSRKQATKAKGVVKIKGVTGTTIPLGTKVASDDIIFETINEASISNEEVEVNIQCIQAGSIGNLPAKAIKSFPITIQGLQEVINIAPTTGGFEEENDKSLLERYLIAVREPATSGNIYHYRHWTLEVAGVGGVKVFPLWNGNGTVKLAIVNSKMEVADSTLIGEVQKHIDIVSPIGATVTVVSARNKSISITAKIRTVQGAILQNIQDSFKLAIKGFFKENAFKSNYVSIAKVGNILLSVPNVLDYSELKLNNTLANIELTDEEIPLLSDARLEVIQ